MSRTARRLARVESATGRLSARWAASFRTDLRMAKFQIHQGQLSLSTAGRLALWDSNSVVVDARFLHEGKSISVGDEISFPCHKAIVGGCIDKEDLCSPRFELPEQNLDLPQKIPEALPLATDLGLVSGQHAHNGNDMGLSFDMRPGMEFQRAPSGKSLTPLLLFLLVHMHENSSWWLLSKGISTGWIVILSVSTFVHALGV